MGSGWHLLWIWLGLWISLCLARIRHSQRLSARRGRHALSFTGWTLVWQYNLPAYGPPLLPQTAALESGSILAAGQRRGIESPLRRRMHSQAVREEGAASKRVSVSLSRLGGGLCSFARLGFSFGLLCFALGQVSFLLLLLLNLVIALDPSALTTHATPSSFFASSSSSDPPITRRHLLASPLSPPSERRHVASLLRPMVPGLDHPPLLLWVGVLLAVGFHELGHALAAVVEGLQVRNVGVYVAVLIPGAYVTLDERLHRLSPISQLRVYTAGVWHNVLLTLLLALVLSLPYTPLYGTGVGAVVTSVAEGSSFHRALRPGMRITSIQDHPTPNAALLFSHLTQLTHETLDRATHLSSALTALHPSPHDPPGPPPSPPILDGTTLEPLLRSLLHPLLSEDTFHWWERTGLTQSQAFVSPRLFPLPTPPSSLVPPCCSYPALSGELSGMDLSCFLLLGASTPARALQPSPSPAVPTQQAQPPPPQQQQKAAPRLVCLSAREVASHHRMTPLPSLENSHAAISNEHLEVARERAVSEEEAGGMGQRCYPVTLPPNALLKLTTEGGYVTAGGTQQGRHVLVFEGPPSELLRDIEVSDYFPSSWLHTLLPLHLSLQLPGMLRSLSGAVMDVSLSIACLNLLPLPHLDGSHAASLYLRLLGFQNLPRLQRALTVVTGALAATNLLIGGLSLVGEGWGDAN